MENQSVRFIDRPFMVISKKTGIERITGHYTKYSVAKATAASDPTAFVVNSSYVPNSAV